MPPTTAIASRRLFSQRLMQPKTRKGLKAFFSKMKYKAKKYLGHDTAIESARAYGDTPVHSYIDPRHRPQDLNQQMREMIFGPKTVRGRRYTEAGAEARKAYLARPIGISKTQQRARKIYGGTLHAAQNIKGRAKRVGPAAKRLGRELKQNPEAAVALGLLAAPVVAATTSYGVGRHYGKKKGASDKGLSKAFALGGVPAYVGYRHGMSAAAKKNVHKVRRIK